jgi:hypothetical protein
MFGVRSHLAQNFTEEIKRSQMRILFILYLLSFSIVASSQHIESAFTPGAGDLTNDIAVDGKGYTYLVSANYNSISYAGFPVQAGNGGIIVKSDSMNNIIWIRRTSARIQSIAVDTLDHIYITGTCGNATFYGTSTSISVSDPGGQTQAFVAQYDASGEVLWVRSYGYANAHEGVSCITADKEGNTVITGGSSIFGGPSEYFVNKYDSHGNLLWNKTSAWSGSASFGAAEFDPSGHIILCGRIEADTYVGPFFLTSSTYSTFFISKFDGNGNCLWAKTDGSNHDEGAHDLSIDSDGNIYVAGVFAPPSNFSGHVLTGTMASIFVAKYDHNGNNLWVTQGGQGQARGLDVDQKGNCVVTGWFYNSSTFGQESTPITLTSTKWNADVFFVKYTKDGVLMWATCPTSSSAWDSNKGMAIATSGTSTCYATGGFSDTTVFGIFPLYAPHATHGLYDMFLVKIRDQSITGIEDQEADLAFSVYPNPSGSIFHVRCEGQSALGKYSLSIKSLQGMLVWQNEGYASDKKLEQNIDLGSFSKGIYLIELVSEGYSSMKKIVLQ